MSEPSANECISVNIDTAEQLYAMHMSFIKDGAIFIPTTREFALNDQLVLKIKILDEPRIYELAVKVVWVTPNGAQRGLTPGIGLQFIDTQVGSELLAKINTSLVGVVESGGCTETM